MLNGTPGVPQIKGGKNGLIVVVFDVIGVVHQKFYLYYVDVI